VSSGKKTGEKYEKTVENFSDRGKFKLDFNRDIYLIAVGTAS
jgi:hypothetical protein